MFTLTEKEHVFKSTTQGNYVKREQEVSHHVKRESV